MGDGRVTFQSRKTDESLTKCVCVKCHQAHKLRLHFLQNLAVNYCVIHVIFFSTSVCIFSHCYCIIIIIVVVVVVIIIIIIFIGIPEMEFITVCHPVPRVGRSM